MENFKNVPKKDLDAIMAVGSKQINSMRRKYSAWELEMLEERAKYRRRLNFWENGFEKNLWKLAVAICVAMVLGACFGGLIMDNLKKLPLWDETKGAIICGCFVLMVWNIYDIGRINFNYDSVYEKKSKRSSDDFSDLKKKVDEILLKEGGMSATKIGQKLDLQISATSLGKKLKNMGFSAIKTSQGRKWQAMSFNVNKNDIRDNANDIANSLNDTAKSLNDIAKPLNDTKMS